MRRYTASEAIGPAWGHTLDLLWRGRRMGTGLKLALVALLAELPGTGFRYSWGGGGHSAAALPPAFAAVLATFGAVFLLVGFVVGIVLLYVGSRMQFVLYELVAARQTVVAPAWRRYGTHVWKWIGLKVGLFLALMLFLVPIFIIFRNHGLGHGTLASSSAMPIIVGPIVLLLVIFVLLVAAVFWSLRDFVLPSLVLEDTSLGEAIRRFRLFLQQEPGGFTLYILLRVLVGIVFALLAYMTWVIALLLSGIPFAIIGAMVWMPARHAGGMGHAMPLAFIGLLILGWVVCALVLAVAIFGTLITFYQAWAQYFLGGRYPLLGDMLERPVAVPVYTPPPSFPGDDDSGGPDLPLNPELAS